MGGEMKHDMDSEDFKLSDMRIIRDNEIKHLKERIAKLEARVDGYERLLDEAYDEYLSGCTADELHDILKEVLEHAPRRNWGKR
jgi:predicted small metal-binding protein